MYSWIKTIVSSLILLNISKAVAVLNLPSSNITSALYFLSYAWKYFFQSSKEYQ